MNGIIIDVLGRDARSLSLVHLRRWDITRLGLLVGLIVKHGICHIEVNSLVDVVVLALV